MIEKAEWHSLESNPYDLPSDGQAVLGLCDDGRLVEMVYMSGDGFKDPDFSNWFEPAAWIEKEKIIPGAI